MNSEPFTPFVYHQLHQGNPGDRNFYLNACRDAQSVLELGCGWGRIGLALARQGCQVLGIDIDKEMVAAFNQRAAQRGVSSKAQARLGHMSQFQLASRFDRVTIPYNALLCLTSEKDTKQCFANAFDHLNEGGQFIFDFYQVLPDFDQDRSPFYEPVHLQDMEIDGELVAVFEGECPHQDPRRLDTCYTLYFENGRKMVQTIKQRYLLVDEVKTWLKEVGFVTVEVTGDFQCQPLVPDDRQVVVIATRANPDNSDRGCPQ